MGDVYKARDVRLNRLEQPRTSDVEHSRSTTLASSYGFPKGAAIDTSDTALSVSPDRRWFLYTELDQAASNLMLVDGFR